MKKTLLIQPFAGWRPRPELAAQVAAPPYDVLSSEEARCLAQNNPYSFLHVSKAEIDLDPAISPYDPRVYARARACFYRWREESVLVRDEQPLYYLYRLVMEGRSQVGVVAAVAVQAYLEERVRKHELTRPDKENDRTEFAWQLSAHSGPVFLIHRSKAEINDLVAKVMAEKVPVNDFIAEDGVCHTLWPIDDPARMEELTALFEQLPVVYVADGHHRSAAAVRVSQRMARENPALSGDAPCHRFLAVLFPAEQVRIYPYYRIVRDLNGLGVEAFLQRLQERFIVSASSIPVQPEAPRHFGLYLPPVGWFLLALKEEWIIHGQALDQTLDVSLLSTHLLEPILAIQDLRRDKRIDFVGGIHRPEGVAEIVDRQGMAAAFTLFPTSVAELMAVADVGGIMPPKSTWFEPKLRDGLVVQGF